MKKLFLILLLLFPVLAGAQQTIFVPSCAGDATLDTAKFTAIKTTVGSTNAATIKLPYKSSTSQRCKVNNLTLTSNITLDNTDGSGVFVVTGQTLTVVGPVVGPVGKQIFYNATAGLGTVSFASSTVKPIFHPEWWGAKADNSTDSSAAILAMFAATGAGAKIELLAGTYITSADLTIQSNNTDIGGAGRSATLIKQTVWGQYGFIAAGSTMDSLHIHDLAITSTATPPAPNPGPGEMTGVIEGGASAIRVPGNPTNTLIERVTITKPQWNGVFIAFGGDHVTTGIGTNNRLSYVYITYDLDPTKNEVGDAGIQLGGLIASVDNCYVEGSPYNGIDSNATDTTITNCYLKGNGRSVTGHDTTARNGAYVGSTVTNVLIEGNTSIDNGNATAPGDGVNVSITTPIRAIVNGNIIKGNTRYGIQFSGDRAVITNNNINHSGTTSDHYGITSDSDYGLIAHNIIEGTAGRGINTNGNYSIVQGNTVKGFENVGIEVGDGADYVKIVDNTVTSTAGDIGVQINTGSTFVDLRGNVILNYTTRVDAPAGSVSQSDFQASDATPRFFGDVSGSATFMVANNGTGTPTGGTANFSGLFIVNDTTPGGKVGVFSSGGNTISKIADAGGAYTTTLDNASTINVYLVAGVVTLQNKTGSSITFRVMMFRSRDTN